MFEELSITLILSNTASLTSFSKSFVENTKIQNENRCNTGQKQINTTCKNILNLFDLNSFDSFIFCFNSGLSLMYIFSDCKTSVIHRTKAMNVKILIK